MENEARSLVKVWSTIFASLCYCYFIVTKIPKGKFRLISILPILCLHTFLPLQLSAILSVGATSFFITIASFKLLLFSFNLGPLTVPQKGSDTRNLDNNRRPIKSLSKFIFIAGFPVKGNDPSAQNKNPTKVVPLNLWSKPLISAILIAVIDRYKKGLHPGVVLIFYRFLIYVIVDVMVELANMLIGPLTGMELYTPSDEPYLSTSLQDFWGRRWNLMVIDAIRQTVYFPTRVFLSNYIGKQLALVFAYLTSFLVSGLMHELIFYYMTRVSPSWEVTWFFVLHGVCVVVEVVLKKVLGRKVRLHWAVTGPMTIGFVMGTGYLWFFPPLLRNQVDVKTIEELKTFVGFIKRLFV